MYTSTTRPSTTTNKRIVIKSFTAVIFFAAILGLISLTRQAFPASAGRVILTADENPIWNIKNTERFVFGRNLLSLADNDETEKKCQVHRKTFEDRCKYMKQNSACNIDDGFINYIKFVYCVAPKPCYVVPILILVFILLLFLFIALGATAEDFFCPSLRVISHTLKLSQNVAGVTFLAFGNGAPDIFSLVAAISNSENGDAGLAIGALFGAGIFVTTIVAGSVAWTCTFTMAERPFLRDVVFYIAAIFWVYVVLWKESINMATSIGLLGLYAGYVAVVVIGRKINQAQKKRNLITSVNADSDNPENTRSYQRPDFSDPTPQQELRQPVPSLGGLSAIQILAVTSVIAPSASSMSARESNEVAIIQTTEETASELQSLLGRGQKPVEKNLLQIFFDGVCPVDADGWKDMSVINRIYEVVKAPLQFLLLVTTPVVDYDADNHNWNKPLNSLQLIIGPMFFIFATKLNDKQIAGGFVAWHLVLCVGVLLFALVFFTSKKNTQPIYHWVFGYVGFLVAVIWIYSIANEIVNALKMYGVVCNVSDGILGLTLLAWGNSIGDLISNTTMARQGFPRMAISACFGGPFFNMLVGIGISCMLKIVQTGSNFYIKHTDLQDVLAFFLLFSLMSSLFIMVFTQFRAARPYSIFLISLYLVFLIIAILVETKTIHWG